MAKDDGLERSLFPQPNKKYRQIAVLKWYEEIFYDINPIFYYRRKAKNWYGDCLYKGS
jgi:hypothetical protein